MFFEVNVQYLENLYDLHSEKDFGKTIENVEKHKDIKITATDARRNDTVLEPNYHKNIFWRLCLP